MEIETTLRKYGCDSFMFASDRTRAMIGFEADGRRVKFVLPLPDQNDRRFTHGLRKGAKEEHERSDTQKAAAYEQEIRRRWRALALAIKAKLECVESGITTFEQEFLAHIVVPNGQTIGEWIAPQLQHVYASGEMPPMLPGAK